MTHKTVLIGIDGATFSILDPLMRDGVMPFLQTFIDSGVRSELRSVVPPLTPPAWTSLMTGRSPGHHGIFDFFCKVSPESPQIRVAMSNDVHAETIWSLADRHGLRTTVLNFPMMFPPVPINGYVVPGWMPWRQLRLGCHPKSLYDRVKTISGFNPRELGMDSNIEAKGIEGCEPEEYEGWIELHIRREQQWFGVLQTLMREEPCDLTAVLFDGVDRIQHLCWQFLDPSCWPASPSPWMQQIRERCLTYFRELDRLISGVIELAGPDATVVMASDHGFGPQFGTFFVNAWLEQQGYLAWADDAAASTGTIGVDQLARHTFLLDWERTVAYAPTPSANGIHIVKAGPDSPHGVPEADYKRVRDALIDGLKGISDPVTGEPIVKQIWTREEAFDGPHMDLAPDLTLSLQDGGMISIVASDTILKPRPEPTGTHRPEGIFMARGPGMRQGVELPIQSILNVPSLVLYSLGMAIPEEMEGSVPAEAFEDGWFDHHPIRYGVERQPVEAEPKRGTDSEVTLSEEDELIMAQRLRQLGYID